MTVTLEARTLRAIQRLDSFQEVLEVAEEAEILAVNLAVGHDDPEGTQRGGRRACDLAARERWGEDRPDLPLVPPPGLLAIEGLEEAQAKAREAGWVEPTGGIWRLRDRLAELDEHANDRHLHEARTEASFAALHDRHDPNTQLPMPPSSWDGLYARLKLLADQGLRPARSTGGVGMLSPKDAVGATAVAWTAQRLAAGRAQCLPAEPPEDPRTGRPVAIWS